jgi:cytochrome c
MKTFLSVVLAMLLFACTNSPTNQMQKHNTQAATDSLINDPSSVGDTTYLAGARLIAKNDCLSCHKINVEAVGPSYKRIAAKYELNEGNVENLAHKIMTGGMGQWTTKNAMPPHSSLSTADANEMAKYILSLRNAQ